MSGGFESDLLRQNTLRPIDARLCLNSRGGQGALTAWSPCCILQQSSQTASPRRPDASNKAGSCTQQSHHLHSCPVRGLSSSALHNIAKLKHSCVWGTCCSSETLCLHLRSLYRRSLHLCCLHRRRMHSCSLHGRRLHRRRLHLRGLQLGSLHLCRLPGAGKVLPLSRSFATSVQKTKLSVELGPGGILEPRSPQRQNKS